jgi:rhomboid protease GluP
MLFFFMLTGILAGAGSEVLGLRGVGIGASGSLMGFIGMAAGWGQKDGGRMGLAVRDMMVKWALYTVVFGVLIRADNAAHVTGFLSGALIGWISKPQWRRPKSPLADWFFGLAGAGAAIGTVLLILFPPPMTF